MLTNREISQNRLRLNSIKKKTSVRKMWTQKVFCAHIFGLYKKHKESVFHITNIIAQKYKKVNIFKFFLIKLLKNYKKTDFFMYFYQQKIKKYKAQNDFLLVFRVNLFPVFPNYCFQGPRGIFSSANMLQVHPDLRHRTV